MELNKLHQVAIHAEDLEASRKFYEDVLGARHIASFDPPGLVFFDFSGVRLLLEKNASPGMVYFWVDDIDAATAELKAKGVTLEQEPHMIFPDSEGLFGPAGESEWMAFFKDPAGNTLALASRKPIG